MPGKVVRKSYWRDLRMIVQFRAALGGARRRSFARDLVDALIFVTLQPLILPTTRARLVRNEIMRRLVEHSGALGIDDPTSFAAYERKIARFGDALVDNNHPLAQPCSALAKTLRNIIADIGHATEHVDVLRNYLRSYLKSVNTRSRKDASS